MNILVTGGNGQLGSELKELAPSVDHSFTFIDIEDLDLTDHDRVISFFDSKKVDIVINCAAYTAVDQAEDEKDNALLINAGVPDFLSELSKKHKFNIVHISTDFVFDGEKTKPYNENDSTNPLSVYGKTKLEGEAAIVNKSFGGIIIRTSWLYSRFGGNFVKTISRLAKSKDELKVVVDQIGNPTSAADFAQAILSIINHSSFLDSCRSKEVFHFCNSDSVSWYEFAKEICKSIDVACKIIPIPSSDYKTKALRPKYSTMDTTKIETYFNLTINPFPRQFINW